MVKDDGGRSVLFDPGERPPDSAERPPGSGRPRLRYANRQQVEFRACAWDDLVPEDHQVRIVWAYVEGLDLSALLEPIRAVQGHAGAPPADPRILMTLWLYATLRGIGSARELARRCDPETGEVAFQWICGGVSMNYHTLADFRVAHMELLDQFLTQGVAALRHEGLVDLERVAQDGMRVRASAGSCSFRRRKTLEDHLAEAEAHLEALKQELDSDSAAASRRQQAARKRAARERAERIRQALGHLPELEAKKKKEEKDKARASTTDAEARVMKMGDGGYRPAYNAQFATDTKTQIITGVESSNSGSDRGQMAPMVGQHQSRYEKTPDEMLVDGAFATKPDIEEVSPPQGSTTVYAPVQKSKTDQRDPHTPRPDDSPPVAAWRERMATDEAKEIYKERASTAECVNAIARNRGLQQFRVRGLRKVRAVLLWYVLAHNLIRAATLRAQRSQEAATVH